MRTASSSVVEKGGWWGGKGPDGSRATSVSKAGHGGTGIPRWVSRDSGRFEARWAQDRVTPLLPQGPRAQPGAGPRGAGNAHPGGAQVGVGWRGCARERKGPMETSGRTIHPPVGPQGASHERCRAAPRGTERGALLGDQDSAGEAPLPPPEPKNPTENASSLPPGNFVQASPSPAPPRPFSTAPSRR